MYFLKFQYVDDVRVMQLQFQNEYSNHIFECSVVDYVRFSVIPYVQCWYIDAPNVFVENINFISLHIGHRELSRILNIDLFI
jgi:hypothetical protein